MENLLNVEKVSKSFGGINALNNLSFSVSRGEVVGVIGPNGSGKSTLINLISGVYKPSTGRILFDGKNIVGMRPWEITRQGIVRTFQIPAFFKDFTVHENIVFPACFTSGMSLSEANRMAEEVIASHGLDGKKRASELTLFEERKLELLRVFILKPKLVLIDEALSGLTAHEAKELAGFIVKKASENMSSVIWVEHRVKELTKNVNRLIVLNYGNKLAEGHPTEVVKSREVVEAYLGG
ncbi:MAG: ATP-binding cassette domain-containing protein [Candidatus Caldarchaeum sp.]